MKKLLTNEKGNVLLIVSIAFTGLLAMTGLVIDGGSYFMKKTDLQKVVNAAALSGAQELVVGDMNPVLVESRVRQIVHEVVSFHDESIVLNDEDIEVQLNNSVTVNLKKPLALAFSSLFGIESVDIVTRATAGLGIMGSAQGAAPLGIERSTLIENGHGPNHEFNLKVDQRNVETGNFGALALGSTGADTFEENLKTGFNDVISINQILDTEAGNMNQPTNRAVTHLINQPCDGPTERNCPRRILVPVYEPIIVSNGRIQQIKVVGFAYFYISAPFNSSDSTVRGYFVEYADTGIVNENAESHGAYSIRLIE